MKKMFCIFVDIFREIVFRISFRKIRVRYREDWRSRPLAISWLRENHCNVRRIDFKRRTFDESMTDSFYVSSPGISLAMSGRKMADSEPCARNSTNGHVSLDYSPKSAVVYLPCVQHGDCASRVRSTVSFRVDASSGKRKFMYIYMQ